MHKPLVREIYFTLMKGDIQNASFRISLLCPIHIINLVDKTKISCYTFPPLPPKQQHIFLGTWPLNLFLITLSLNFSLGDLTTPQLSFCLEQI